MGQAAAMGLIERLQPSEFTLEPGASDGGVFFARSGGDHRRPTSPECLFRVVRGRRIEVLGAAIGRCFALRH